MNKFNLTFSGEILNGHDPDQVKRRFAQFFGIEDPARAERFFSGQTVILRRSLERKAAGQLYQQLHRLGALTALVKVTSAAHQSPTAHKPSGLTTARTADRSSIHAAAALPQQSSSVENTRDARSWPVSAAFNNQRADDRASAKTVTSHTNSNVKQKSGLGMREKTVSQQDSEKPTTSAKEPVKIRDHSAQNRTPPTAGLGKSSQRPRQPGAPNAYALRPFRNTAAVRNRSQAADQSKRYWYCCAGLALLVTLLAGSLLYQHAPAQSTMKTDAIATSEQNALLLLAADSLLFHDRAGNSTNTVTRDALGLSALTGPIEFNTLGDLLVLGRLSQPALPGNKHTNMQLLRCNIQSASCRLFSPALDNTKIQAFTVNAVDNSVLVATKQELVKLADDGSVSARVTAALPRHPVLRLHAGLLYINSATGPGISVYRYENSNFGRQLDEILLLPSAIGAIEQTEVTDFLFTHDAWWVGLRNMENGTVRVYRFDNDWNSLGAVNLPVTSSALAFIRWGTKVLINNSQDTAITRVDSSGRIEAPFVSAQLDDLIQNERRNTALIATGRRWGLPLLGLTVLLCCAMGYFYSVQQLVYQARRERGAPPLDERINTVQWIDPAPNRQRVLLQWGIGYSALISVVLYIAIAKALPVAQMAALAIICAGPLLALLLQSRSPTGHIGILQAQLLLVNHRGVYHLAGGSNVSYRGAFLLIDDVVVFSGNRLLPAFRPTQICHSVAPLATAGVKVDHQTVLVKLLQSRHPIAMGVVILVFSAAAAAAVLYLQWAL